MGEISYLHSPATRGYEETRSASYNDDGTLAAVGITVKWDNGTEHTQRVILAGPPDYTFEVLGSLAYPDGSTSDIKVSLEGRLHMEHNSTWISPDATMYPNEKVVDFWDFDRDGTGEFDRVRSFEGAATHGLETEHHSFNRDGTIDGDVTMTSKAWNRATHEETDIDTTITLQGQRTDHTTIKDADGNVIDEDVHVYWVPPPADPVLPPRETAPPPEQSEETARPPSDGPQPGVADSVASTGSGGGGVCALPRAVKVVTRTGDAGAGIELCMYWTDYYVAPASMHVPKAVTRRGEGATYIGSRYQGVAPC